MRTLKEMGRGRWLNPARKERSVTIDLANRIKLPKSEGEGKGVKYCNSTFTQGRKEGNLDCDYPDFK